MDVLLHSTGQKKQCQTMDFVEVLSFKKLLVAWECSDIETSICFVSSVFLFDLFFRKETYDGIHLEILCQGILALSKFYKKDSALWSSPA